MRVKDLIEVSGGRCSGISLELKDILTKVEDKPRICDTGRLVRWNQAILTLQALSFGWYAILSITWPKQ